MWNNLWSFISRILCSHTRQKMKFSITDLVTFTEEIRMGKFIFPCSDINSVRQDWYTSYKKYSNWFKKIFSIFDLHESLSLCLSL